MVASEDGLTLANRARPFAVLSRIAASARFLCVCVLLAFAAAVVLPPPADAAPKKSAEAKKKKLKKKASRRARKIRPAYAPPQAAMVVDLHTGKVLFEDNADKARFPASITKVMTLYMLFEQMKKGEFGLDTELKVSEWAASRPPSKLGMRPGQSIKVYDAMLALVTKSANDVASVVAENIAGSEEAFARMMTHKARMIGMTSTTFVNASGLPDERQTTTARDLITLGRRVIEDFPAEAKIFQTRLFEYGERTYQNHNRMLFSYAGMEGMKTGYTRASGFNLLASCRRNDKHLIAVVLGGSSSRNRNGRMRVLLDRSWRTAVAMKKPPARGTDQPFAFAAGMRRAAPEGSTAFQAPAASEPLQVTIGKKAAPGYEIDIQKELVTHADAEDAAEEEEAEAEDSEADGAAQVAVAAAAPADKDDSEAAEGEGDLKPEAEAKVTTAQSVNPSPLAVALLSEKQDQEQTPHQELQTRSEQQPKPEQQPEQRSQPVLGPYHVQVGSFVDTESAKRKLEMVAEKASGILNGHAELTVPGDVNGKAYYRARFGKFSRQDAANTCTKLKRLKLDCLVVRVE
jgi:D-alanyl-D-alanine carboxypeptidase